MTFQPLENKEQLQQISDAKGYQVIFKHNTTCPISRGVWDSLEKEAGTLSGVEGLYFLDLLNHRDISDSIAEQYGVKHESPQILLIRDGQCTYHEWGYDITAEETAAHVK